MIRRKLCPTVWSAFRLCCLATAGFLGGLPFAVAVPPNVTALFPSGGQIGKSIEVAAQGAVGDKPQVWLSRDGLKVEFAESGNKFKVTVAENATPGLCWMRLFNAEGASPLRPFVIGTLPEFTEIEPNNGATEAQKIDSSQFVVNGVLDKNGDVDTFAVALKSGQTLVASLMAKQKLGSPMDGVLQLLSPRGFVLEHNDDDRGFDPQIVFTAPADGSYSVRVFAFPEQPNSSVVYHGGANYIYRLTLTTGPFVDHALPMSVTRAQSSKVRLHGWNLPPELAELTIDATESDTIELHHPLLANTLTLPVESTPSAVEIAPQAASTDLQEVVVPSSLTGVIGRPGETDLFRLKLQAKQAVIIRTDSRTSGSPLDPVLRILKADGSQLQELDDGSKGDFDPDANFTAPADGEYRIAVTDRFGLGGPRFFYRLVPVLAQPDFELRLASDAFVLSSDKPLEIPVTIERQRGFAQELDFVVTGLPDKVTADPVVSAKEGDTAKAIKLILKAEAGVAFSGPIQIRGRSKSEPAIGKDASAPLASFGTTTGNLWLTVK